MTQTESTAFNVVFEGRFVDGRDPMVAQTAFAKQYGDTVAGQVFGQKRAVLKRNVTQDAALKMQGLLAEVGVMVALTPAVDPVATPKRRARGAGSIVERAAQRAQSRKQVSTTNKITTRDTPDPVDRSRPSSPASDVVADTSPVAPDEAPKSRTLKWFLIASAVLAPLLYLVINNVSFL